MDTAIRITQAELLSALANAAQGATPAEARTTRELAQEHGLSEVRIGIALRTLHDQGLLVVHNVQRVARDGKQRWVPAYTILPAQPE